MNAPTEVWFTQADVDRAQAQAAAAQQQLDDSRRVLAAQPHANEYARQIQRCIVGAFFVLAAVAGACLFALFGAWGPGMLAAFGVFVVIWSGEQARRARKRFNARRPL